MSGSDIGRRFGFSAAYGCGTAAFQAGAASFHVVTECRDLDQLLVRTDTRLHGDFNREFKYERQLKTVRPDDLFPHSHQQRTTYRYLGPCPEGEL